MLVPIAIRVLFILLFSAAAPLFAVNIYVLFWDTISKYSLILLLEGGWGKAKCQKWLPETFSRLLLMKVIEFCISFNFVWFCWCASECCVGGQH